MFATRVLMQAAAVKKTTGIVGLAVVPNAREELSKIYKRTLEKVQELPRAAPYRQSVEQITSYRLSVVEKMEDHEAIEAEIDCGQVEELLEQAKDEWELIDIVKGTDILKPAST